MGTGATLRVGASNAEFNKAMKDMATQMKSVKSEFTLASTQAKLFGTETDSLKAKQSQLTSTLKIQNDMLKNQENQLKTLAENTDKLKTKQSELASKIAEATNKYKESVAQTGKNSEESKKLKDELDKLKELYAKNDKAIDSNNSKMASATQRMNGTKTAILENSKALDDVEKKLSTIKLDNLANGLQKVSDKSGAIASKLTPASTAITGLGIASATASAEFEDNMAKVFTIADESEVSYDDMKKSIMDLSHQTGISANEIANNVYDAISAGQKTGDAVNFVGNSTKLAKAGFAEAGQSLDLLTTIMNSYGLEAKEVTNVSDTLVTTQNLGKTTVGQLSESMGKVIPTAKAYGVNLNQVSSAYALMTSKGIATSESGTYISSMLNELGKSGTNASNSLKNMTGQTFQEMISSGKSLGDILSIMNEGAQKDGKSLSDLFGSAEAGKAALILSGDAGKDFNNVLGQMANSAGATDKAFATVDNTTGSKLKKSFNDLKLSAISMGDALAPVTSVIADGFKNITQWLSTLNQEQLQTIAKVGLSVVAFTGLMKVISIVSGGLSSLIKVGKGVSEAFTFIKEIKTLGIATKLPALSSGLNVLKGGLTALMGVVRPIITTVIGFFAANPIILGITAVIAIVVLLYNKCEWFRNGVNEIVEWFKTLPAKAVVLWENIKSKFDQVINFFKNNWKEILLFIVNPFAGAFALLYKNNETFRNKVNELMTKVKEIFVNGWNAVKTFFTTTIPQIVNSVVQWFVDLPNKIAYALGSLVGMLASWGVSVWNYFNTNVPIWINNVTTFFSQLPTNIWNFLVEIVTKLGEWGSNVLNYITTNVPIWINNVVTFFSELPNKIWEFLVSVVTKLGEWGSNVISWITTTVPQWIENIVTFFSQLPSKIWEWLVNVVSKVTEWGGNMLTTAKEGMQKVFDGIIDTFKNLPSKMMDIGKNIVLGIKDGIKGAWDSMTGWIGGLCNSFTKGVKDKFEIHSPSHIFRDEIGKMLAMGIGVGFEQEMPQINTNIGRTIDGTVKIANLSSLDSLKNIDKSYSNNSNKTQEQPAIYYITTVTNLDGKEISRETKKQTMRDMTGESRTKQKIKGGALYV